MLPLAGNNLFPTCLAGARARPPEDCGGPYGYQELLEALREPHHERHAELAEWLSEFSGGEGFDPERFNLTWINHALRTMAKRRSPARASSDQGRRLYRPRKSLKLPQKEPKDGKLEKIQFELTTGGARGSANPTFS